MVYVRWLGFAVLMACGVLGGCAGGHRRAHGGEDPRASMVSSLEIPDGVFSDTGPTLAACRTVCDVPSSSDVTPEAAARAAASMQRAMGSLHACLSTIGADRVEPVIFASYADSGALTSALIDLGGIEAATCVEGARAALPARAAEVSGRLCCRQRCESR